MSIIPPDYQPLIRYIYYTTGLPFRGTFIVPPGGKPFRGVSILPRGRQGSPLFKTPVSIIPPVGNYDVEGAVSAPERLNDALHPLYRGVVITVPLSVLTTLYIHYTPVITTVRAL